MNLTILMPRTPFLLLILLIIIGLSSCSTVTTSSNMTIESPETPLASNLQSVALVIEGRLGGINGDNFRQALEDSLINSGVFKDVDDSGDAPCLLIVHFDEINNPYIALSVTINIKATWTLYRTTDRMILMQESIDSIYTGGSEGGFFGMNRVRRAREGAARENIRLGVEKLMQVYRDGVK